MSGKNDNDRMAVVDIIFWLLLVIVKLEDFIEMFAIEKLKMIFR
jgi:hypothetical protein